MKLGGSHNCTIVDGDEYPTAGLAHPPCSGSVFAGVGLPAVGVAGGHDLLQESPDGGPIRVGGIANLHFGILTVVPVPSRRCGLGCDPALTRHEDQLLTGNAPDGRGTQP
jgi:hypothetical protein